MFYPTGNSYLQEIPISISSRPCWYLQLFKKDRLFNYDWWLRSPHLALSHYYQAKLRHLKNPGPKRNSNQSFSICHWNLNSITAHNCLKISLLRVYILLHNFGLVCISEIYLDLTTAPEDKNLEIAGYNLLGADHASNYESGVFAYIINVHLL